MELCETSLESLIESEFPVWCEIFQYCINALSSYSDTPEPWDILHQLSAGLEFIHSLHYVHRDLKPSKGMLLCVLCLCLVLYASRTWKIGGFSLTCEGTDRRTITTRYSRGTAGYRAPELLKDDARFSQKVDIWALGCVAYRILTRKRLFQSDYEVFRYTTGVELRLDDPFGSMLGQSWKFMYQLINDMLSVEPTERPTAQVVRAKFAVCRDHVSWVSSIFPRFSPKHQPLKPSSNF